MKDNEYHESKNNPEEMEPFVSTSHDGERRESSNPAGIDRSAINLPFANSFEMIESPSSISIANNVIEAEVHVDPNPSSPTAPSVVFLDESTATRVLHASEPYMTSPSTQSNHADDRIMVASGVAGMVVGSLLFGPILGAIAGFGTAYATKKEGPAGDIARAMGDVALTTRDKAIELDNKHRLVEKSKDAVIAGWEKAKALDQEHQILIKIKDFIIFSWRETVEFSRRHRLLERGVQGVGKGFEWLFRKLFHSNGNNSNGVSNHSNNERSSAAAGSSNQRVPGNNEMPGAKPY
jgi:hypothetical protein